MIRTPFWILVFVCIARRYDTIFTLLVVSRSFKFNFLKFACTILFSGVSGLLNQANVCSLPARYDILQGRHLRSTFSVALLVMGDCGYGHCCIDGWDFGNKLLRLSRLRYQSAFAYAAEYEVYPNYRREPRSAVGVLILHIRVFTMRAGGSLCVLVYSECFAIKSIKSTKVVAC